MGAGSTVACSALSSSSPADVSAALEGLSGKSRLKLETALRRSKTQETSSSKADAALYRDKYTKWESLWEALATKDTILVSACWLVEWHRQFQELQQRRKQDKLHIGAGAQPLPRRQELPSRAIVDVAQMQTAAKKLRDDITISVLVSVSYAWVSPTHPDPNAEQMQIVCWVSAQLLNKLKVRTADVGIFIDWCSLFQHPRSSKEEFIFKNALRNVNLWYSHQRVMVWLLTQMPSKRPSTMLPYDDRGWPYFERAASSMIKDSYMVMDLGLINFQTSKDLEGKSFCAKTQNFVETRDVCIASRVAPIVPDIFDYLIETKTFTNGADIDFVQRKYRDTFVQVMECAEVLDYRMAKWNCENARHLAKALPFCTCLQRLLLCDNYLRDEGGVHLAGALLECLNLKLLKLSSNEIGDEGAIELSGALLNCPEIEIVGFHSNRIGDASSAAFVQLIIQCVWLRELDLDKNLFTVEGTGQLRAAWTEVEKAPNGLQIPQC